MKDRRPDSITIPDNITIPNEVFKPFVDALAAYLDAIGWRAVLVGNPRIQQQPTDFGTLNYEFVMRFTGGRKREASR